MAASKPPRVTRGLVLGAGTLIFVLILTAMGVTSSVRKVQTNSMRSHIECDLFQMLSASEQFYLETGKDHATYDDIVGPEKWIRQFPPPYAEYYRKLEFRAGQDVSLRMPDGTVYTARRKR